MSHSFTNLLYHIVFATKERQPWLETRIRSRVFEFLGGLFRKENGIPLIINGMPDHVHVLAKLRQDKAISDSIRAVKALSSGWIRKTFPDLRAFAWQTGYGCFTVSQSQVERVREYIKNQETHHQNLTFRDELITLLRAHDVEFDEELLWE